MNKCLTFGVATLSAILSFAVQAASIKVYPVSIDTESARTTINIVNEGAEPLVVESSAYKVSAISEAQVFPPVAKIGPGEKQVFRVVLPSSADKTQYWRVRIAELSEKKFGESGTSNGVQNQLSFEIPVFLNKKGAKAVLERKGEKLINVGERQILITKLGEKNTFTYLLPEASIVAKKEDKVFSNGVEVSVVDN